MKLIFCGIFVLLACVEGALKLPNGINKCSLGDQAALDACILVEGRKVLAKAIAGELQKYGLRGFDPLYVDKINVEQPSLKLVLENVKFEGNNGFDIRELSLDVNKKKLFCKYTLPKSRLEGKYTIDADYRIFKVKGSGDFVFNYEDITAMYSADLDLEKKKDGNEYFVLKNVQYHLDTAKSKFRFTNLFGNEKTLEDSFHQFLDENSKDISEDTKSVSEEFVSRILTENIQHFFSKVPYSELFENTQKA